MNNPAKFDDGYHFRIKFEAIAPLAEGQSRSIPRRSRSASVAESGSLTDDQTLDLEWRLIYVGSAKSEEHDQELDSCMGESATAGRTLPP